MGFVTTIVRGSLWRRKGRTVASILGVALGIAMVVAIFVIDFNTIKRSHPKAKKEWTADLEVRAARDLNDPIGSLSAVPGVGKSTIVYKAAAEVSLADGNGELKVNLIAIDGASVAEMDLLVVESGEFLYSEATSVLIGRKVAEDMGLGPGDILNLSRPQRAPRTDCLDGEFVTAAAPRNAPRKELFTVAGVLAYENVGRLGGGSVVVINSGAAIDLFGDQFLEPNFWVTRDPSVDIERLEAGLSKDFAYNLRAGSVVGQKADERAFRNGVRLAGLMALALGLFVIFHTLAMSLVERMREVAVVSALGASRSQVTRIFFSEALVISLVAGAMGLGGGLLLARKMMDLGISSLGITNMVKGPMLIPWTEVLGLTGLGIGIALVGSIYPLMRSGSADMVAALRGEDSMAGQTTHRRFNFLIALLILGILPTVFFALVPLVGEAGRELLSVVIMGITVLALLLGTPLLVPGIMSVLASWIGAPLARLSPFAGLLAARSISRNPRRIAASVVAIALVTAAFVAVRGLTGSLHFETKLWAAEAVDHKVYLAGLEGVEWERLAVELEQLPSVLAVEPGSSRIESPFRIQGIDGQRAAAYGPMAEDEILAKAFVSGPGMLISSRLASQRGLKLGDSVQLATPSSGVKAFRVIGITDSYGYFNDPHERAYGVIDQEHLGQLFCMDIETTDVLAVRFEPGPGFTEARDLILPQAKAAMARLGMPVGKVRMQTGSAIRTHEVFDILRDFLVFDVIILLTLIIAGVGVLNGQLLAAMERFKELGVLRALGADARQIRNSVLFESAVIGLAGSVIGVVIGWGMVYIMVDALKLLSGLELPQVGLQWDYLWAGIGAFLVAILAGVYPIWKMNRMDPVRAVRTG